MAASNPHLNYRADVDGLRAVAVLSVVGFHAFPGALRGGFVGVDVFFVISGFLISGLIFQALREGRFSYLDFYVRRVRRIFPALFTVLATCLIVGGFWLFSTDYKWLGREAAAGAGFVANFLFWSEAGYFDSIAESKPLLHLWSLGVEEQFYFVWPILVTLFYRRPRTLLWLIGTVLLASFAWNVGRVHADPSGTFYLPMSRFWELLVGSSLAYATVFHGLVASEGAPPVSRISPDALSVLGLLLILGAVFGLKATFAFPGWWALLPVLGALCIIAARGAWLNRVVLSHPVVVFIGLISYPLYLWHWVLLTSLAHLGLTSHLARLAAVAVSFLLAWLTYQFIEKPIRFGARTPGRTGALVAATAVAGIAGMTVFATDGLAFRYPPDVRALASFKYDGPRDYREGLCQLDNDEPFSALASQCVDPPSNAPSTLLVLWGDSHASSLYQGLKALAAQRPQLRLAQFTAAGCPPLVGGGQFGLHETCEAFGNSALQRIRELRPDIVVLEGFWQYYGKKDGMQRETTALRNTIRELQKAGIPRIVVFGPLPRWLIDQPTVGLQLWEDTHQLHTRTSLLLDPDAAPVDAAVRTAVADTGAQFVSPLKLLCNPDGCLISTEADHPVPLVWDNIHLTSAGSKLLINLSSAAIFGGAL